MVQWCHDILPSSPRFFFLTIALEVAPSSFMVLAAFSPEFHSFSFAGIVKGTDCSELLRHIVNLCWLRLTPIPHSCPQASIPHLGGQDFLWRFPVSGAKDNLIISGFSWRWGHLKSQQVWVPLAAAETPAAKRGAPVGFLFSVSSAQPDFSKMKQFN